GPQNPAPRTFRSLGKYEACVPVEQTGTRLLTPMQTRRLHGRGSCTGPLMNRIEGRIRTREQIGRYTAVLVHKLEARQFQDERPIDRIDRLLDFQQRLERVESSLDGVRSDSGADGGG